MLSVAFEMLLESSVVLLKRIGSAECKQLVNVAIERV